MIHLPVFITKLGQLGVFILMAVENIGIPIPTEFGYLYEANLIKSFWGILGFDLFLMAGNLTGSLLAYFIGREGDTALHKFIKSRKGLNEAHVFLVHWYGRYGSATVFLARFIGYVRPWSSFIAGLSEFPFLPFFIWTVLGTFIFNFLAIWLSGYILKLWILFPIYRWLMLVLGVALSALIVFLYPLYKRWTRQHHWNNDGKSQE